MRSAWSGGIWFNEACNAVVFDCKNSDVTLCMPCTHAEAFSEVGYYECDINTLERNAVLSEEKDGADKSPLQ